MQQKQFKREVFSNTVLPQEIGKTSNRQPNVTTTTTGKKKRTTKKPKVRRKEIRKTRTEISEKEMKDTVVKIYKTKTWLFEKINKIYKPLGQTHQGKKKEESN